MLNQVLEYLNPKQGEIFLDCTLGGAGHSFEIAKKIGRSGCLIGIDQDDLAREAALKRLNSLNKEDKPICFIKAANFSQIDECLTSIPIEGVDCILFDLGVSSPQFDVSERGFTYHDNAPLDMRMDRINNKITAARVVNTYKQDELESILKIYGEEKFAKQIARNICEARENKKIEKSEQLVDIIKNSIPASKRRSGGHPAKRTFQALRIEVNNELNVLKEGLESAIRWLNKDGRIVIISYHSLEDRIVKNTLKSMENRCICDPQLPICQCGKKPILKMITKKAILPESDEIEANNRSRSAKLRAAYKL